MAVCNLFNELTSPSGNFLMFSQYVEDITRNFTEGDNWKVVPTGFVALNIDYSKINKEFVLNKYTENLNTGIPKYFQNYFENACAYGRNKTNWDNFEYKNWTSEISRNLFWNAMFDGGFIHTKPYPEGAVTSDIQYIPEVVYFGDINMHSYNEHKGMGYGEIYCYIPSDAKRKFCQVLTNQDPNGRVYDATNESIFLEGYTDKPIENYSREYFYNRDYSMKFDDSEIDANLLDSSESRYNINTIVILYSVFNKIQTKDTITGNITSLNSEWMPVYSNMPMGIYFSGNFDNDAISNPVVKYVTTSYDTGTAYGLRICTRLSATSNGTIYNTDIIADDSDYSNMCQLMSAMSENLALMLDITKQNSNLADRCKALETMFETQKYNVPYVKNVNGVDCWFVNGKLLATVNQNTSTGINSIAPDTVQQRIDALMDNDPTNDYTYIDDPNGDNYIQIPNTELAEILGLDPDEFENNVYIPVECECEDYEIADENELKEILDFDTDCECNICDPTK